MKTDKSCRLCMSTNGHNYLEIFSGIGIEMKIGEIISEHFKCEVSEHDSLPNLVCETCWQITKAFNELYEKSKLVQEHFLNPLINVESDENEVWQSNKETDFIKEADIELGAFKIEPNLDEESNSNDYHQMDYDGNLNVSDEKNDEDSLNDVTRDDPDFKYSEVLSESKKKRQRASTKSNAMKFAKLFEENKHLFDMTCDSCTTTFKTFDDARTHYAKQHKNTKGYIKCCSIKLKYPCDVINHLKRHLESKNFKCTECPKEYWNKNQLERHMQSHTKTEKSVRREKKTVPCNICKKFFTTEQSLQRHMKRHKKRDKSKDGDQVKFIAENFDMKCDFCDTIFGGLYDARDHYKNIHNEDRGYIKCCKVKLREHSAVKDHIRSHLDPECFKCTTCGKIFMTKDRLNKHKRRHRLKMNKSFICDFCKKVCGDKEQLLRHMFSKHEIVEAKYECKMCHKKFQLPLLLKTHMYAAHREKKTVSTCEICGKGFKSNCHLEKHKLRHINKSERLSEGTQCSHCGEWLLTKSGVFYHKQIHTSGPQKCSHCELECSNRVALLAHIRHNHREHTFNCRFCEKTFPIKSILKKHEESHTRHRVFSCQFCDKTFTVGGSLLTHMGRHHPEEKIRLREMKKMQRTPTENKDQI